MKNVPTRLAAPAPLSAANDNARGPRVGGCRWRLAIDMLKPIWPPLAVFLAQEKLRGADLDATLNEIMEALSARRADLAMEAR